MPEVPEVSAIVEQVKARTKKIETQLARHERLSDELARLRDALGRLEGVARSHVGCGRRGRRATAGRPRRSARPVCRTGTAHQARAARPEQGEGARGA